MSDPESLQTLAHRIRATGALGRSQLIQKLFDFLIDCSATGRAPKETEVAIEVFGKDTGFDVAQDAMVRVYVHKLRRKLEEYYSGAGHSDPFQLTIPKGRVPVRDPRTRRHAGARRPGRRRRLRSSMTGAGAPPELLLPPRRPAPRRWILPVLLASVVINLALAGGLIWHAHRSAPVNAVRSSAGVVAHARFGPAAVGRAGRLLHLCGNGQEHGGAAPGARVLHQLRERSRPVPEAASGIRATATRTCS